MDDVVNAGEAGSQKSRSLVRLAGWAVVVLAGVLASGVVPAVRRLEMRWLVGRCPIAYVAEDGRIHLTSPWGKVDVELEGPLTNGQVLFSYAPLAWSPDGEMIAYFNDLPRNGSEEVVVIEPVTGARRAHTSAGGTFGGWMGKGRFLDSGGRVRDARTGQTVETLGRWSTPRHVAYSPQCPDGVYVVTTDAGDGLVVQLWDETMERRWHLCAREGGHASAPRVDGSGEWVGWTNRRLRDSEVEHQILFQRVGPRREKPRRVFVEGLQDPVFCDWTDDGEVLVNARKAGTWGGSGGLYVLDKDGRGVRRIHTRARPMPHSTASWRRVVEKGAR